MNHPSVRSLDSYEGIRGWRSGCPHNCDEAFLELLTYIDERVLSNTCLDFGDSPRRRTDRFESFIQRLVADRGRLHRSGHGALLPAQRRDGTTKRLP